MTLRPHVRYSSKHAKDALSQKGTVLATKLAVLLGDDAAAYDQFLERDLQDVYNFTVRELEYHDALDSLPKNEIDAYDIIDEAFVELATDKQRGVASALPPRRRLEHKILEVLRRTVDQLERQKRREVSPEANYQDPLEENGFVTLGEHVLDYWQPDQDLTRADLLPDLATPSPAEIEDMKSRQHEIYAALNALPKNWREDFVLFAIERWTAEQLASRHGVPLEVIKDQIHATQHFLLERLRERSLLAERQPPQPPHLPDHA